MIIEIPAESQKPLHRTKARVSKGNLHTCTARGINSSLISKLDIQRFHG